MIRSATLSSCARYRYSLGRQWGDADPLAFVMLNPSTADADLDDPTIRRCVGFAKREGAGGIVVANLFALRSTSPAGLWAHPYPVGPENDAALVNLDADRIVAAWGAEPSARERARTVHALLRERGMSFVCLGTTADGSPRHPLYVRGDAPLVPWSPR